MFWIASSILTAGLWAAPLPTHSQATAVRQKTEHPWRVLIKKYNEEKVAICSVPLLMVPLPKNVDRMPTLRPPAESENIYHMPLVKLPAPPCQEEKR